MVFPKQRASLVFTNMEAILINDYLLYIFLKVIVCFLDQYSMIKYAFLFNFANLRKIYMEIMPLFNPILYWGGGGGGQSCPQAAFLLLFKNGWR